MGLPLLAGGVETRSSNYPEPPPLFCFGFNESFRLLPISKSSLKPPRAVTSTILGTTSVLVVINTRTVDHHKHGFGQLSTVAVPDLRRSWPTPPIATPTAGTAGVAKKLIAQLFDIGPTVSLHTTVRATTFFPGDIKSCGERNSNIDSVHIWKSGNVVARRTLFWNDWVDVCICKRSFYCFVFSDSSGKVRTLRQCGCRVLSEKSHLGTISSIPIWIASKSLTCTHNAVPHDACLFSDQTSGFFWLW